MRTGVPVERVDAVVGGDELGMALAEELQGLAPFGRGNPAVSLMVADATFADVRAMGEGKHARFTVARGRDGPGRSRSARVDGWEWPRASRRRRRSRWRSTSGTASASRGWCCATPARRGLQDRGSPGGYRSGRRGASVPAADCRSWCCSAEGWRQAALVWTPWCGQPRPSIRAGGPLTCDYGLQRRHA